MRVGKRFASVLVAGLLAAVALPGQSFETPQQKARRLLLHGLERIPCFNVIAVIMYSSPDGDESEQVKVELRRDGRMHRTVLAPLSRQGLESVDDGKTMRTFVPDRNMVMIQQSSLTSAISTSQRLNLIDRNYRLRIEDPQKIANREAFVILASPRASELEARRLYLDASTGYVLKLEIVSGGHSKPRIEAKSVSYPRELPDSLFELKLLGETQTRRFPDPTDLRDVPADELPFKPMLPTKLPFGFVVSNAEFNAGKWKSIAVRITDGLVRGTVYQAKNQPGPELPGDGASQRMVGDIRLTVLIDAPEAVRERILQSFAQAFQNGLARLPLDFSGLQNPVGTLLHLLGVFDGEGVIWPTLWTNPHQEDSSPSNGFETD